MPAGLHLEEFGSQVWSAFGHPPYLVGSVLRGRDWHDVDVRLILPDDEWEAMGLGKPGRHGAKWSALCMAFAALGHKMTGLPIDFQIQQQTHANKVYDGPRFSLGLIELRERKP